MAAGIRKHDTEHIIFFEPVTWGMIFDGNITGSGYTHVPGGEQYMDRYDIYSYTGTVVGNHFTTILSKLESLQNL